MPCQPMPISGAFTTTTLFATGGPPRHHHSIIQNVRLTYSCASTPNSISFGGIPTRQKSRLLLSLTMSIFDKIGKFVENAPALVDKGIDHAAASIEGSPPRPLGSRSSSDRCSMQDFSTATVSWGSDADRGLSDPLLTDRPPRQCRRESARPYPHKNQRLPPLPVFRQPAFCQLCQVAHRRP